MKSIHALPFRTKLLLVFMLVVVLTVSFSALTLSVSFSQQVIKEKKAHLELLTLQTLQSFKNRTDATAQQLYNMINTQSVIQRLYAMRNTDAGSGGYYQRTRALIYEINQMVSAKTYYDHIYIRLNGGQSFANSHAPAAFISAASVIIENYKDRNFGTPEWFKSETGEIYVIRDIYHLSPFHHLGKVMARVRQSLFTDIGLPNSYLENSVLIFGEDGLPLAVFGKIPASLEKEIKAGNRFEQIVKSTGANHVAVFEYGPWKAAGVLPVSVLNSLRDAIVLNGILVSLFGIILGAVAVISTTKRMTRQMKLIVKSMDAFASGDIASTVPVVSGDEVGQMAMHFNRMSRQTQELLNKVVFEANQKSNAEYEMLEYKYRSLQSQINPHFIYNAMETINALAKLDGNEEICHVVKHFAGYFRENARNADKRYITVSMEFESLKQYAYIYRYIHGDSLTTPFYISKDAEDALVPTMILQPVLENALIHGVRPASEQATVAMRAEHENNEWLVITITDNGQGMDPAAVERILGPENGGEPLREQESSGIGLKNVKNRLGLIFGERGVLSIKSEPGLGTTVTIRIPLFYDESDLGSMP